MRIRVLALAVALLAASAVTSWAPAPVAWACSCVAMTTEEYADSADVVARGTVTAVESPADPGSSADDALYTLRIDEVWKGRVTTPATVLSAVDGASCGWEGIEEAMEIVLFGRYDGDDLRSNLCDGSGPADADVTQAIAEHLGDSRPALPAEVLDQQDEPQGDGEWSPWLVAGIVIAMIGAVAGAALAARRR